MEIKKAPMYHRTAHQEDTRWSRALAVQTWGHKLGFPSVLCAAANPTLVRGGSGGSWGLASCPVLAGKTMDSRFTEELLSQKNKVESDRAERTLDVVL